LAKFQIAVLMLVTLFISHFSLERYIRLTRGYLHSEEQRKPIVIFQ